jgi:hypothetical protein
MFRLLSVLVLLWSGAAFAADNQTLLTGKNLETAKEMNMAYAQHLYSATCLDRQKAYFLPRNLTPEEGKKRIQGFQKSCDCMAGKVIEKTSPNAVVDYVTQANGISSSAKKNAKGIYKLNASSQFIAINNLTVDKDARRSCGLQK